jgi:CIC family chloride channel protein
MKVTDAMHPFGVPLPAGGGGSSAADFAAGVASVAGPVTRQLDPQVVFAGESLGQALRQLEVYGRDGLPVISADGQRVEGWVTSTSVLRALARQLGDAQAETARAQLAADWEHADLESSLREPPSPLHGYRVAEITITDGSPAGGQRLADVAWPAGSVPVTVLRAGRLRPPEPGIVLRAGDRISLLAPAPRTPGAASAAALPAPA